MLVQLIYIDGQGQTHGTLGQDCREWSKCRVPLSGGSVVISGDYAIVGAIQEDIGGIMILVQLIYIDGRG
jgi:hypothetical protein